MSYFTPVYIDIILASCLFRTKREKPCMAVWHFFVLYFAFPLFIFLLFIP